MLKPLETQESVRKKQRTRNIIIGVVIIAVMVLSSLGYVVLEREPGQQQGGQTYNNFTFTQIEDGWQTKAQGYNVTTIFLPQETLNASSGNVRLFDFSNKIIFIVISSKDTEYLTYDLFRNLQDINQRMQFACPVEQENSSFCLETNLPLKSCDDASLDTKIMIIKDNETQVGYSYNESCLTIKGTSSDVVKATDNFIFKLFGII